MLAARRSCSRRSPAAVAGLFAVLATLVAALWVAAVPARAAAARLDPPQAGRLDPGNVSRPFRDRVVHGAASGRAVAARARARAAGPPQRYATGTGESIQIQISQAYGAAPPADVGAFATFLGSRLHGPEISRLLMYIAPASEIASICGAGSLACYSPAQEQMYVPGQLDDPTQPSLEYVITHEFGHHIAQNRLNTLEISRISFPAIALGAKRWATYKNVCLQSRLGRLFPGDQGAHYFENPGEAWAESFAVYHYRNLLSAWRWSPLLQPDDGAFAAMEADVRTPWTGNTSTVLRGRFRKTSRKRFKVDLPLDGQLGLRLAGPRGSNFDLRVRIGRQTIGRTKTRGSHDRLTGDLCGVRNVDVEVLRKRRAGRFKVTVSRPV